MKMSVTPACGCGSYGFVNLGLRFENSPSIEVGQRKIWIDINRLPQFDQGFIYPVEITIYHAQKKPGLGHQGIMMQGDRKLLNRLFFLPQLHINPGKKKNGARIIRFYFQEGLQVIFCVVKVFFFKGAFGIARVFF